jgi:hypothetical protein
MHETPPEKTFWGWKALIVAIILSIIFLAIFYLAMENDPDYMPSQQIKEHSQQQHAFKSAPTMSPEALEAAQKQQAHGHTATAAQHGMTEEQHANMDMSQNDSNHGH